MKLNKLYLESIRHFDPEIVEWLIREAPHITPVRGEAPPELHFLQRPGTVIDLGIENLPISKEDKKLLRLGFVTNGIGIPGTGMRFRYLTTGFTAVEPAAGNEPMLPSFWRKAVLVIDTNTDRPVWVGDLVRDDQVDRDILGGFLVTPDGLESP